MVFNDPHLPWERIASSETSDDYKRNRVPWLAVLVFTPDELRLSDAALSSTGIFSGTGMQLPVEQTPAMAVNMSIGELWKTTSTSTPIQQDDAEPIDEGVKTDVVFVEKALFTALFTGVDGSGNTVGDVTRYRFLAHVRNINTTGMAEAGVEDEGLFSVVVSHRVGPSTITQPAPVVVHLLSIEGVEGMTFPLPSTTEYVAFSSLHSWSYMCLPPTALNVFDAFQNIGNGLGLLRAPEGVIDAAAGSQTAEGQRLAERLKDGYTLTRYRTQTGEVTAALVRGAFTPRVVPNPLTGEWRCVSNFGEDLQILDQEIGLMDVTYSVAWQLGKTMAMADQAFTAALGRVRSLVYDEAMDQSKISMLKPLGAYKTREETLKTLKKSIGTLGGLPGGNHLHAPNGMLHRWHREPVRVPDLKFGGPNVTPMFAGHARRAARKLASSNGDENEPYDETNSPYSTDWMVVFKWVLDRMYLVGIPAHYLITDPSHLPPESLRFYSIDANWVEALIDGALSIANHTNDPTDPVRASIKLAINDYIQNKHKILKYAPQIPAYGFLLRSDLVTQFPDLVVSTSPPPADGRAPLLRHENIDSGVMLCLFDSAPGTDITKLTFGQPPHQQSFVAAAELTTTKFKTSYKRVYTVTDPVDPNRADELGDQTWTKGDTTPAPVFVWGDNTEIRTLLFPAWAKDVFDYIKAGIQKIDKDYFTDTMPSAALCGIQLNNPIYQLDIQSSSMSAMALGTDPKPRTFKMLHAPRRHQTPVLKARTRRAPPPARKFRVPPIPSPGNRTRMTPIRLRPPPHFRSHRATPTMREDYSGPATPPVFSYRVYAADSDTDTVPTYKEVAQDIIFGIILQSGSTDDFYLKQIVITLPLGGMSPPAPRNFLESYEGPGATMLSNLRFNVSVEFGKKKMVLKLLPRSTTGKVPIARVPEASFVLSLVKVNPWTQDVTVKMTVQEIYHMANVTDTYDVQMVAE